MSALQAKDYAGQVAARRKLAIGVEILASGPITGTRMLAITRAAAVPCESPAYPNTLRQHGFLTQVPGRPTRWKLSAKGEAWVKAIIAGEQAEVKGC